jgi:hypothetical protein
MSHICQVCGDRLAVDEHHIIPKSRTSKKHPATWVNDKRNLILLCRDCHDDGQTVSMRKMCIIRMMELHPDWDYDVSPWKEYIE